MKEYEIKVETFKVAGKYQHNVYETKTDPRFGEKLNKIIKKQKSSNKKTMEEFSLDNLVTKIKFKKL